MEVLNLRAKMFVAFTLAEVLITLGIIGVVAALTIPILMKNTSDAEFKSLFKKQYSVANQAFQKAALDNGGSLKGYSTITGDSQARANELRDAIVPYVSYVKKCDFGNLADCTPVPKYTTFTNGAFPTDWSWGNNPASGWAYSALTLKDGSIWYFLAYYADMGTCTSNWIAGKNNSCGMVAIDTNGAKKPNQAGYDLFEFHVGDNGILVPMGTANDAYKDVYAQQIGYNPRSNYMLGIEN